MASIREMAIKYAPHPTNKDWNEMQKQLAKLSAYEDGANEALDLLYNTAIKEDWITNPKDGVRKFFEMYKELKFWK